MVPETDPLDFGAAEERGGSSVAERGVGGMAGKEGDRAWRAEPPGPRQQLAAASAFGRGRGRRCALHERAGAAGGAGGGVLAGPWGFAPGPSAPHDWAVERGRRREVWGAADWLAGGPMKGLEKGGGVKGAVGEGLVIFWVQRAEPAERGCYPPSPPRFPPGSGRFDNPRDPSPPSSS